jgi:UDP-2-acetamido-2-deoxy-ribo-hexuluronate aminotransferase
MRGPPRQVPFFDCSQSFARQWSRLKPLIEGVADRRIYSNGPMVEQLEAAIRRYTGAKHAIAVNSGTDALIWTLRAAGVGSGDEVIVPCFSFVATASSVALAGAEPVFVDVEHGSYAIDIHQLQRSLTNRTRAIMPVHLFSQMADMAPILEFARNHDLLVIEDSAEAIGMRHGGTHAGLMGDAGVLSFFPTKTLGALGDGGMILTNDDCLARTVLEIRDHGSDKAPAKPATYDRPIIHGIDSKMDEVQAAVLTVRLQDLDYDIARRAALARFYDGQLAAVSNYVKTPRILPRGTETVPVYYVYLIEAERKRELVAYLKSHGVATEEYYPKPLHLQPCFADLNYHVCSFPNAERMCELTLALPLYPDLSLGDATHVCETIRHFYREGPLS